LSWGSANLAKIQISWLGCLSAKETNPSPNYTNC
jgi:hypothetical protein